MANWNTQGATGTVLNVSGNAASTLTSATVSTFFQGTEQPGEFLLGLARITAAAETVDTNTHMFAPTGNPVVATKLVVVVRKTPTFTSGSSPTITVQGKSGASTTSASDSAFTSAVAIVSSGTTAMTTGGVVVIPLTSGGAMTTSTLTTLKAQIAITGSATNWSGALDVYLYGTTVLAAV